MTVRLHIERLVVEGPGLSRAEAESVQAGLEAILAERLMTSPAESWVSLSVPMLALEPVRLPRDAGSELLGRQAGVALLTGLLR